MVYYDSQETSEEDAAATNAIDGKSNTYWHTLWSSGSSKHPHEIQIDLGKSWTVGGFRYLPIQSQQDGRIKAYEFYVSDSTSSWGTAVATGSFTNDAVEKTVTFTAKSGRYIRIRALSEVNGNPWTSIAELNVLTSD